jgi:Protein of unknown function (DUF1382)
MSEVTCSLAEIRTQMEIAQALSKAHQAFVVVPVSTRDGFEKLCGHQAQKLEALARAAEIEQSKGNEK